MTKVVCTVPAQRFARFGVAFPAAWQVVYCKAEEGELMANLPGADFLLVGSMENVTPRAIDSGRALKLIHTEGVGFNRVDTAYARTKGIDVCNNRATNNGAVAEHTIGLMLAALRRTVLIDRQVKAGEFLSSQSAHRSQGSTELGSRHVGLIGIGAIGKEVAKRLAPFGCAVSYYDAFRPTPEIEAQLGVNYLELDALIATCDIISVHVPVLPSTEGMLGSGRFNQMKPETVVINTARGEIINTADLAKALEEGRIAAAGLDTIFPEPPDRDTPILNMSQAGMDRLVFTPHIAGTTDEAFTRMLKGAVGNMERVAAGDAPVNIVN